MTKIIHFHPSLRMASRFVTPLINEEQKLGFNSQLIVSEKSSSIAEALYFNFKINFTNITLMPLRIIQLYLFIKKLEPSMIFVHNSTSSLLPLLASKLLKIKYRIYYNHGVPYVSYKGYKKFLLFVLEYLNCKLSSNLITVSEDMKKLLSKFNSQNINVINFGSACGIDLKSFKKSNTIKNTIKKEYNFKKNDFLVLYVGRPHERKGFKIILNLWQKFFKDNNFKLLICGCDFDDVKKILNKVQENIFPLGFVNDIEKIYHISDILLLPSKHEGFPYAILEAMASNCVVIANNVLGINSLIKNKYNGYLICENNIESYRDTINLLRSNKKLKEQISKIALKEIQKFSRKDFLEEYMKFVKDKIG